jgi:hypothetical protein
MADLAPAVKDVMEDGASSFWLQSALRTALERDPVDALNDALLVAAALEAQLRTIFGLEEE